MIIVEMVEFLKLGGSSGSEETEFSLRSVEEKSNLPSQYKQISPLMEISGQIPVRGRQHVVQIIGPCGETALFGLLCS